MWFLEKIANFIQMGREPVIVHTAKNNPHFTVHNKFSIMITSFPVAQINHKKLPYKLLSFTLWISVIRR